MVEREQRPFSWFAGIVSNSDSEWATRSVRLFFALLVYGFGLGFLARTLRVRV